MALGSGLAVLHPCAIFVAVISQYELMVSSAQRDAETSLFLHGLIFEAQFSAI